MSIGDWTSFDQLGEADATLAANDSRGFIAPEDTVETAAFDEFAAAVEAAVAITATMARTFAQPIMP